jgi:hypothetical protein
MDQRNSAVSDSMSKRRPVSEPVETGPEEIPPEATEPGALEEHQVNESAFEQHQVNELPESNDGVRRPDRADIEGGTSGQAPEEPIDDERPA